MDASRGPLLPGCRGPHVDSLLQGVAPIALVRLLGKYSSSRPRRTLWNGTVHNSEVLILGDSTHSGLTGGMLKKPPPLGISCGTKWASGRRSRPRINNG